MIITCVLINESKVSVDLFGMWYLFNLFLFSFIFFQIFIILIIFPNPILSI